MAWKVFTNKGELLLNTIGGGGGGGSVTSFSAGYLSPLFTTSVTASTTTPALSFSLNNQSANLVFAGPSSGPDGAPTFRALTSADFPGGVGTVTSVAWTTSQGVSASIANPTGAANITITLGALTGVTSYNGLIITADTGAITTGIWNGTKISEIYGGTNQSAFTTGDILYASAANTLSKLPIGSSGQALTVAAGIPSWTSLAPGGVTNVSGTTNRITSTGGSTPVIDISASYVGQASITTIGTIATGVWNGTVVAGQYGGTGVANTGFTITLAGNLATTGAFNTTFAAGFTGTLTLPTATATLYSTQTGSITSAQLATSLTDETGTGVVVFGTAPTFTTSITDPLIIGGITTTSTLTFRTTSHSGGTTGADFIWQGGNNGATEFMRLINAGTLLIGATSVVSSASLLEVNKSQNSNTQLLVANGNGGAAALSSLRVTNTTTTISIYKFGGAYTTSGPYFQDGATIEDTGVAGLTILTTNASATINFWTNSVQRAKFLSTGSFLLSAGTATAGSAPIKLTSGTNLTTGEAGAFEYDGTLIYFTPTGTTRHNFLFDSYGKSGGSVLIGGTGVSDTLTFQTTAGVGTTGANFIWQSGNNGGTELMRLLNNGTLLVGATAQSGLLNTDILFLKKDLAASNGLVIQNSSASNGAYTMNLLSNGTSYLVIGMTGTATTTSQNYVIGEAFVAAHTTNLNLSADDALGTGKGINFWTVGTKKMSLASTGELGVGLVPASNNMVDMYRTVNNGIRCSIKNDNVGNNTYASFIANNASHYALFGIVGTGTTTSGNEIQDGSYFETNGAGGASFACTTNASLTFWTNGTQRLTITGGGNVGVGLSPASYKLEVAGDMGISVSGKKLRYKIGTTSTDAAGSGTLVAGTATITTSAATASSLIFLQDTGSSLVNVGSLQVTKASGSFVVTSSNALDTSTFDYWILEPY